MIYAKENRLIISITTNIYTIEIWDISFAMLMLDLKCSNGF